MRESTPPRVLLVEDEQIHGRFVEFLSSEAGIAVDWARSLGEATQRLGQRHYDAFLLDLCLPDSHGAEVVTTMRAADPHTPIVVVTSNDDRNVHAQCLEAGAAAVLRKGALDAVRLCRAIEDARILRSPAAPAPPDNARFQQRLMNLVSHCVRTPLTPIAMRLDLLRRQCPEAAQAHIDSIERQLRRLENVAHVVAETHRAQSVGVPLRRSPVDLVQVLHTILEDYALGDVRIAFSSEQGVRVEGDAMRIAQGIEELLRNAIEASQPDGVVRIKVSTRGGAAIIDIEDSGPGVDPSLLPYLFRPFVHAYAADSPEPTKLGLGLHLALAVAEAHYGEVRLVRNNPAVFRMTLPAA